MAEYIEREALIEEIEKNIETYWNEGSGGYYLAEDALNYSVKTAPTAAVVPKSEYDCLEKLFNDMTQEAKGYLNRLYGIRAEVAREIFEEIEKHLIFNTYGIATISDKTFAELKKKYIGEQ